MKAKTATLLAASCLLLAGCEPAGSHATTGNSSTRQADTATNPGPTAAPDLRSVGAFRAGPETDDGTPTTLVDFTFDQKTFLTGGDRTNFKLVPRDGGEVVDGTSEAPKSEEKGDGTVTVVFPGDLKSGHFARGYVDAGKLSTGEQGGAPTNVMQTARIGKDKSAGPDLTSVTRKGNRLYYEFDAGIDPEQVNDTGGFRAYDTGAKTYKAIKARRSKSSPKTIVATFDDFDVSNAVGASVNQGAVEVTRDGKELPNEPDEAPVSSSTRASRSP